MADTPDLEEQKLREQILHLPGISYRIMDEVPGRPIRITGVRLDLIVQLLHQHHNALLRELEGKLPHEAIQQSYLMPDEILTEPLTEYEKGRNSYRQEVKQILADARVGGV